jgi:tetratricopeptide (TPR) repeat protein
VLDGRADAALVCFDRALARDPRAAYGFFYRAGLRLLRGDESGALDDLEALSRLRADFYVRYREFEIPSPAAYPDFEKRLNAFAARTRHPFSFLLRAFARRSVMRFTEAVADMERAVRGAPRNAGLRAVLARVRFVNHLPDAALVDLTEAVRLDPRCGWIRAWRSEALRHRGRLDEALADSERAIRLDPHYFRSYAWRGGILRLKGRDRRALADFDRALSVDWDYWWGLKPGGREADPNLSWLLHERFLALRSLGRTGEAVRELNRAHALNTRYGWVWTAARDAGAFGRGEAELSAWLEKHPRDGWARAWRGWTRIEERRAVEALEDLNAAVRALPLEARPHLWRARALAALGERHGALKACDRACRLDPVYAPAHAWRGGLLRLAGRPGQALAALDRALELDPVLAWAWAWKGELLLRLGRPIQAREPLRRATALDPSNSDAAVWRAEAFAATGLDAEARRLALGALRRKPGHWRAYALLSVLAGRQGRAASQRSYLKRALASAPKDAVPETA